MAIVYRTDGAWGTGKGSNLAPAEVDGNFYDIDQRVTYWEDNPPEPIKPISITIAGYNFTMGFDDGTLLGPITMTMPVPEWRGDWTPNTIYKDMDFFTAPDGGFGAVMQGHTSAATFDWAALGTNGLPNYRQIVGANGMTVAYSDLTDVALSGLATGDMMVWGGTYWQNRTPAQIATALPTFGGDSGTGGSKGLVPAPAAGDAAASKFLSASGTWVVPPSGTGGGSTSLAGLTDVAIVSPANLSLLQYNSGTGKWHNHVLADLGAGTVTRVDTTGGISGGPITASGTLSLAPIAAGHLLGNPSGASAAPGDTSVSQLLDAAVSATRGAVLRRDATGWTALAPGSAGQYLQSGGTGADVSWGSPAGLGTVTAVYSGTGLTGGPVTGSGTLSLAPIATATVLANPTGGSAAPASTSVSQLLDAAVSNVRGSLLRRGTSGWTALTPGTAGQVLTSGGTGADVSWGAGGSGMTALTGDVTASGSGSVPASVVGLQGRAVSATAPTSNQVLQWSGTAWAPATVSGGAIATVGDTFPSSPVEGALHWLSTDGQLYIRYGLVWVISVTPPSVLPPGTSPNDNLIFDGTVWRAERPRWGAACFVPGLLTANQDLLYHAFAAATTIPANFGSYLGHGSQAGGSAAATASTVITVSKAVAASPLSFSTVGTITFAASGTGPTFATSGGTTVSFAQSDILRLRGPATPDATFAGFFCSLVGYVT